MGLSKCFTLPPRGVASMTGRRSPFLSRERPQLGWRFLVAYITLNETWMSKIR